MTSKPKKLCIHSSARLGLEDEVKAALENGACVVAKDQLGRIPLHYSASGGHENVTELLLERGEPAACLIQDDNGMTALALASEAGLPMTAYQVASRCPAACLVRNNKGQNAVELAAAGERGEVLNALLLACSGQGGSEALASMEQLLKQGAVCDTWAPNGSSALMLSASIDCAAGVELLLANGATVELQDALGRTALMFAAGNDACAALAKLLEAGASVSIRDRRGRSVMDYAVEGSGARALLQQHLEALESKAQQLQAALLAELCGSDSKEAAPQAQGRAKKAKKKKGSRAKKVVGAAGDAAAAATALPAVVEEEEERAEGGMEGEVDAMGSAAAAEQPQPAAEAAAAVEEDRAPSSASAASADTDPSSLGGLAGGPSAQSSGPSSLDVSRSPSPPGSPGGKWCTVGRRQQSKPMAVPASAPQQQQQQGSRAGASHQQQHHHHHHLPFGSQGRGFGRLEVGSLDSKASGVRRCPSTGSLASTCSGESHDTDTSRLSGSERSVLRPYTSGRLLGLTSFHSTGAAKGPLSLGATAAASGKPGGSLGQWDAVAAAAAKSPRSELLPPTACWAAPRSGRPGASTAVATSWAAKLVDGGSAKEQQQQLSLLPASSSQDSGAADASDQTSAAGAAVASAAAPAAPAQGESEELAALREQVLQLQLQQREAEFRHRQELAAVLEDAAHHEALAVQQAVSAERMNCIVRFASFLQHSGSTLCASFPDIFATSAPQQQRQQQQWGGCGAAAAQASYESLLATAANNCIGLAQSPPSQSTTFASLAFPPAGGAAKCPFGSSGGLALHLASRQAVPATDLFGSLLDAGSPLSSSPLPTTPFSYQDVEARLRGEFEGNHSAFVVPAAEEPISPTTSSLLSSALHQSLDACL